MENNSFSCCFTGYRPNKFPFKLEDGNYKCREFENLLYETILELLSNGCDTFYCGMAMGFDIMAGEAVSFCKKAEKFKDTKLICVIPYEGQEAAFPDPWKTRYKNLLDVSDQSILISDRYFRGCYQKRNVFMVDNSDYVLTWWDGKSGGTKNTVNYAEKLERQIINLYPKLQTTPSLTTFNEIVL